MSFIVVSLSLSLSHINIVLLYSVLLLLFLYFYTRERNVTRTRPSMSVPQCPGARALPAGEGRRQDEDSQVQADHRGQQDQKSSEPLGQSTDEVHAALHSVHQAERDEETARLGSAESQASGIRIVYGSAGRFGPLQSSYYYCRLEYSILLYT